MDTVRDHLERGGVALLPTETVWGLAARADSDAGVAAIYRLKGRDDGKPLAVCVRNAAMAAGVAHVGEAACALMDAHWPGPLTLVLPARRQAGLHPKAVEPGRGTVGLRCPDVGWREALCAKPLALTSANPSGQPAAGTQARARAFFPDLPWLADDAPDRSGPPTTIVRVTDSEVEILRQGGVRL